MGKLAVAAMCAATLSLIAVGLGHTQPRIGPGDAVSGKIDPADAKTQKVSPGEIKTIRP